MEKKSRERKLPMWQMRMYKEIGKVAHHSGWVHGVCIGHILCIENTQAHTP